MKLVFLATFMMPVMQKKIVFILYNYFYAAREKKVYFWLVVQNVVYFSNLK